MKKWAETWNMNGVSPKNKRLSISLIRYADDFIVIHKDKCVILEAKQRIEQWLNGLGLELKESKTRVCHTLHWMDGEEAGVDFLGWNFRQYPVGKKHTGKQSNGKPLGFKTIIKPSDDSVKIHYQKVASTLDEMRGKCQEAVISRLNPIIKGWTDYHSVVCSKETFDHLDHLVYQKLRRWTKRRHPSKAQGWCNKKYWHRGKDERSTGDSLVFSTPSDEPNSSVAGKHELRKHAWTPIVRHTKVKGDKFPFDGDWKYWSSRRGEYPGTKKSVAKLLKRQKGKCNRCGLYFKDEDVLEIDHIIPRSEGGKDQYKNYQLLHRHCHHEKTAEDKVGKC